MIEFEQATDLRARIKVVGVGGGGGNAVNTMIRAGLSGVDFVATNTDAQALSENLAAAKIHLGERGLGAGADPRVGRASAEGSRAPTWCSSPPASAAAPAPAARRSSPRWPRSSARSPSRS